MQFVLFLFSFPTLLILLPLVTTADDLCSILKIDRLNLDNSAERMWWWWWGGDNMYQDLFNMPVGLQNFLVLHS